MSLALNIFTSPGSNKIENIERKLDQFCYISSSLILPVVSL